MIARFQHAPRQTESFRVPARRSPLDLRPARVPEPEQLRHLVERFARGVVQGPAKNLIVVHPAHLDQQGVTATHNQRDVGRDEFGFVEEG